MTAVYLPGRGMLVTIQGEGEGHSVLLPEHMTVAAIQKHVAELVEWLT